DPATAAQQTSYRHGTPAGDFPGPGGSQSAAGGHSPGMDRRGSPCTRASWPAGIDPPQEVAPRSTPAPADESARAPPDRAPTTRRPILVATHRGTQVGAMRRP